MGKHLGLMLLGLTESWSVEETPGSSWSHGRTRLLSEMTETPVLEPGGSREEIP